MFNTRRRHRQDGGLVIPLYLILLMMIVRVTAANDQYESSSSSKRYNDGHLPGLESDGADPAIRVIEESTDEVKIEDDDSEETGSSKLYYYRKNDDDGQQVHSFGSGSSYSPQLSQSDTAIANVYQDESEQLANVTNPLTNSTKQIRTAVSCLAREPVQIDGVFVEPTVEILNFTKLIQESLLINTSVKGKTIPANCTVVFFYAHWCKFSSKAASHFNALARVFPSIKSVAIDCSLYSSVSSQFGVLSVPTILLFHNGKTIAKYNDTTVTLNKLADFIQYYTDQRCDEKLLNVTSKDFQGPIPSVPSQERDIWLFISWVFIIMCFIYYTSKSVLWRRVVDLIRTTWREAEAQHEHME